MGTLFEEFLNSELDDFRDKYAVAPEMAVPSNASQSKTVESLAAGASDKDAWVAGYRSKFDPAKLQELKDKYEEYITFKIEAKDKPIIPNQVYNKIVQMHNNLIMDEAYQATFFGEGKEIIRSKRLGVDSPITLWGIEWKGELDYLIYDHVNKIIYVVDLKTTSSPIAYFHYAVKKFKYYRQLALYKRLIQEYIKGTDKEDWEIRVRIAVVETTGFHEAAVTPIPSNVLETGYTELEESAELIKWHRANGWNQRRSQANNNGLLLFDWYETGLYEEAEIIEEDEADD